MYQDIDRWYIAGHSLGGAMASQYMEKNYQKVQGMILLGAYMINNAPIDSLVIYGNHANFGDYGDQEGDGRATISHEQDIRRIMQFIKKGNSNKFL